MPASPMNTSRVWIDATTLTATSARAPSGRQSVSSSARAASRPAARREGIGRTLQLRRDGARA
jgi:hypothetical protein